MQPIKNGIRAAMRQVAFALNVMTGGKLTPNAVTLFGFAMHAPIALLIATRHNFWAAGLLLVFGLFDTLDGELARLQKRESITGMLLDSITDRAKEIMLYSGIAYAVISSTGRPLLAVWAVAACGCSLLVSYVNAWGEAVVVRYKLKQYSVNKAFRSGVLSFEVRMVLVLIGLLTDHLALLTIVITIGASYTALVRLLGIFEKVGAADVQA